MACKVSEIINFKILWCSSIIDILWRNHHAKFVIGQINSGVFVVVVMYAGIADRESQEKKVNAEQFCIKKQIKRTVKAH